MIESVWCVVCALIIGTNTTYLLYLPKSVVQTLVVTAVIVAHAHLDDWDDAAQATIPKNMPLFVQHKQDQKLIQSQGFKDVRVLSQTTFEGIKLTNTGGQHGTDAMYSIPQLKAALGGAMGVVFEAAGHETVYVVGDAIWRPEVDQSIEQFEPDVIVLTTGNAMVNGFKESIIMGKEDTYRATQQTPDAKVITVHMDAINHMSVTRAGLADYVKDKGIQDKVLILIDGETLSF